MAQRYSFHASGERTIQDRKHSIFLYENALLAVPNVFESPRVKLDYSNITDTEYGRLSQD